jgi:hypothetical protein
MIIKDEKGKFIINFDEKRRVSFEENMGFWTSEEVLRWHNEYVTKLGPVLKQKPWAKCCDLRQYKTSTIVEEVKIHDEWIQKNGFRCGVVIVGNAIVKMQMKRALGDNPNAEIVTSMEEADIWLKSKGF